MLENPIKVSISQFHGIEINDFAVAVAKTALWIAESQMMQETREIVTVDEDFLPLKTNAGIHESNALHMDWNDVVPKTKLNYIMGNPPFAGARFMNPQQKEELFSLFDKVKGAGNLDYVTCWFIKAAKFIKGTNIQCAYVSTNSITQGDQTSVLWKQLLQESIKINFAWKTFKWNNEATDNALVYCVIIGFSYNYAYKQKTIYTVNNQLIESSNATNINPYLIDAPDILVENRNKSLCNAPIMSMGNQPIDDGNYLFTEEEKTVFLRKEPQSEKYFYSWLDANCFLNNKKKYCLWLGNCSPSELKKMPECLKLVKNVIDFRTKSKRLSTKKLASNPTHFQTEFMPKYNYIAIPEVSSGNRKYIPIGFLTPDILCSNKLRLIPNANLFHFGILTSNVHMAWMRTVCGMYGPSYQYSINIVYNNFPWPTPTDQQRQKIEQTAKAILETRENYPESSLADLYDPLTMPIDLKRAHQANDRAVMEAYGMWGKVNSESECVAWLFKMYEELANSEL